VARARNVALRRGVRQISKTLWGGVFETRTVLAAANSAAVTNITGAAVLAQRPLTVIRFHGYMHVRSDQTAAAESYQVAMGACVVSDQSVAIGVTAVPTPFSDADSDAWFLHEEFAGRFEFISGVGFEGDSGVGRKFDSKAMRKIEDGFQLIVVLENSSISLGTEVTLSGRILLKTH